jgi:hypothetical protein
MFCGDGFSNIVTYFIIAGAATQHQQTTQVASLAKPPKSSSPAGQFSALLTIGMSAPVSWPGTRWIVGLRGQRTFEFQGGLNKKYETHPQILFGCHRHHHPGTNFKFLPINPVKLLFLLPSVMVFFPDSYRSNYLYCQPKTSWDKCNSKTSNLTTAFVLIGFVALLCCPRLDKNLNGSR